jgi:hypothetical protein
MKTLRALLAFLMFSISLSAYSGGWESARFTSISMLVGTASVSVFQSAN